MEGGSSDGDKDKEKHPPGDEPKIKRKMKTAAQLQALEDTYKVGAYPSEALRADLSVQLGLTDRQLQMWFCHRRLKDRKASASATATISASVSASGSAKKRARKADALPVTVTAPPPMGDDDMLEAELGSSPYGSLDPRRSSGLSGRVKHYEPPAQSIDELRAIEFVEAQLGEPLREDGPAFGVEFDPLPPGAFGDSIGALMSPPRSAGRLYETSVYERSDTKPVKDSGRARNEYQFLLEHPTVRSDSYERVAQTHYYGSPSHVRASKTPLLSSGRSYVHGYEEVPVAYGTSSHTPNLSLIAQPGKIGGPLPSAYGDHISVGRESPRMSMARESPYSAHAVTRLENSIMPSEVCVTLGEDEGRVEMKNKSDGAGTVKEFDTQEKRMRRELERQDILRRKREECMKKELERLDREHKKEEERLLREKQREEERYQREQKREMERREKLLVKESIRLEKLRQKEELRREREAARQKAANDRAVTRRLAKESMELIEDERLELMEIAASRKSLSSIVSLDSETLQNLDSYRDMLRVFPPISVQLKNPFAIQPWADSEENVGNLLMVWRFLITFADVLGMWPFTLDEFMQAFHDYDPRLLGEIHVALIKTIIKDIQDVSRTPSIGLGANQMSASNPGGGGHCQIVEGAYTWGFDICSWQHNLSLLTWPEVLRQLALSAGFGPKIKKKDIEQTCARFDIDGDDGMDVVSDLRNGEAVENAVAKMRERGYSNPRKHRLTPGTVKFAAFYVLALEGSRGLNILEVADKIQKSGLRDLTTSKTPEASVAAALSRDTKLFEKTAPSTYCLKSPYRKDPVDAEAILSAARDKVRAFKSGFVDGAEADVVVEANDVETKEDSESDTAEDPEVDDLGAEQTPNIGVDASYDMNTCELNLGNGIGNLHAKTVGNTVNGLVNVGEGLSSSVLEGFKGNEDTDIDESYPGELWVQGLMECEYCNLSVEERLNALVALIGVATEGNTIRGILEERLEAATSMKKQMWAEAQLDKRRLKDEYMMKLPYTPISINKTEANTLDCNSRPSPGLVPCEMNNDNNAHTDMSCGKNLSTPSFAACSDNLTLQQSVYTTERSRAQLKSYIGHRAEEMYTYRSLPLGQDRRHNRYWQFIASASCYDPGAGRVFVELHNGGWRLIDSEEAFDAFLSSLDVRGVRESHLHALLQKIQPLFKETVGMKKKLDKINVSEGGVDSPNSTVSAPNSETPKPSSSFHIESGRNNLEVENALKRYKSFEEWMWTECSSSVLRASKYGKKRSTPLLCVCDSCHDVYFYKDNHCPACHKNFDSCNENFYFPGHITQCEKIKVNETSHRIDYPPARLRLLKALVAQVEVCIPPEALEPVWSESNRESWGVKLHMSSLAKELLQVLTLLEGAIRRDFMSSNFKSTVELLAFDNAVKVSSGFSSVTVLPWIPHTTSAVALRLMELDSAIYYIPDQKIESEKDAQAPQFSNLPSNKYTVGNIQEDVSAVPEDAWVESVHGARGQGRAGPRTRGGKSQGGRRRSLASNMKRSKGGRRKGRRSTTQKPVKKIPGPTVAAHESGFLTPIIFDNDSSPPGFSGRDNRQMDANNNSNSERSDYSNEYEDMSIDNNGKPEHNSLIDCYDDGDYDDDEEEELDEVRDEMGEDYVDGSGKYKEQTGGYLNVDEDVGDGDANQDYSSVSGSSTDYSSD